MRPDYFSSPTVWVLALGSFLLTLLLTPIAMKIARLLGAVDRGGHRCVYNGVPMPLLGGLAIGIPFIAICFSGFLPVSHLFSTIDHHRDGLLALAAGSAG